MKSFAKRFAQRVVQKYYNIKVKNELSKFTDQKNCPYCQGKKFHELYNIDRYRFPISTVKCDECGLVQVNPAPDQHYLNLFYSTNRYRGLYLGSLWARNDKYDNAEKKAQVNFSFVRQYIPDLSKNNIEYNILDFGSAVGKFLGVTKNNFNQIKAYGVEPGAHINYVTKNNLDGVFNSITEIPDGLKFDLITSWHVLEHVYDPIQILTQLKNKLKKSGKLIIEIPNIQKYQSIKNIHIAHLFHFDPETIEKVMSKSGLKIEYLGQDYLQDQKFGMKIVASPIDL